MSASQEQSCFIKMIIILFSVLRLFIHFAPYYPSLLSVIINHTILPSVCNFKDAVNLCSPLKYFISIFVRRTGREKAYRCM
jgi:hypothetical protein